MSADLPSLGTLGAWLLSLALGAALGQTITGWRGAWHGVCVRLVWVQCAAVICAFALLMLAFVRLDFGYRVVFENGHSLQPLIYRISGVWGNHEGSMMLWVLVLSLCSLGVAFLGPSPAEFRHRVLAILGGVSVGFLAFIMTLAHPFDRLAVPPPEGRALNPLLQDPGLIFHPPLLYMGYVGVSVVFAFAVVALLDSKADSRWGQWVYPWTLCAWGFLTAGIGLGSWWAYYELGWGGFWFWDPVENVSFMPWLTTTALLHSVIALRHRQALYAWALLLALLTFILSLTGTFIVRSGILTSVHAFANDPSRGAFILGLLGITTLGSLTLFAWRAPGRGSPGGLRLVSREGAIVLNNLMLAVALTTVLVGTLYPVILEVLNGDRISVGPPYYQATFIPLTLPLLALMGLGPALKWQHTSPLFLFKLMRWAGLATLLAALVFTLIWYQRSWMAAVGFTLALWLVLSTGTTLWSQTSGSTLWARLTSVPVRNWSMVLAHGGVGLLVAGATGVALLSIEHRVVLAPGEHSAVEGGTLALERISSYRGTNYQGWTAHVHYRSGESTYTLKPERRIYAPQGRQTTEAAIITNPMRDLYATLGELRSDGRAVIHFAIKPLTLWLWIGCALMVLGALAAQRARWWRGPP